MAAGYVLNRNRKVPAEETPAFGAIAERFRRAGELERAVELCRDGLQRFPDHLSAQVTLGWSLMDLGRYEEAREALERVLKRAPDNLAAIRGLAELHDRAEHTMMLPMDGPGQWPPPMDDFADAAPAEERFQPALDSDTVQISVEPSLEEPAYAAEMSFPPPMAMPIPAPAVAAAIESSAVEPAPDLAEALAQQTSAVVSEPVAPMRADQAAFEPALATEQDAYGASAELDSATVAFDLAELAPGTDAFAQAGDLESGAMLTLDTADALSSAPDLGFDATAEPELEATIAELTAGAAASEPAPAVAAMTAAIEEPQAPLAAANLDEDAAEIAALEALIAEAAAVEQSEPAFQLTSLSISELDAMDAVAVDEPIADEPPAGDLPLIIALEQWVPEPIPEPIPEPEPEPALAASTVVAFVSAPPPPHPAISALERLLRKVEARRLHLAAESVA